MTRQSEGRYKLGPGTLYDNLQRLLARRLVEEAGPDAEDPLRRFYRLSPTGREVLLAEITRLEGVVRDAKLFLQRPRPRTA